MSRAVEKFNQLQLETIINKTVDLIAADEDKEFFKGVLWIRAQESKTSAEFSSFIANLLKN